MYILCLLTFLLLLENAKKTYFWWKQCQSYFCLFSDLSLLPSWIPDQHMLAAIRTPWVIKPIKVLNYFLITLLSGRRRPRKTKEEMHRELFLRKRSRKNLNTGSRSNLLDFDFNLGTIDSESSSGDETYLVPTSRVRATHIRSK